LPVGVDVGQGVPGEATGDGRVVVAGVPDRRGFHGGGEVLVQVVGELREGSADPVPVRQGNLAIPVIDSVTGQAWINEDQLIPDVTVGETSVLVLVRKLAGIAMITQEAVETPRLT